MSTGALADVRLVTACAPWAEVFTPGSAAPVGGHCEPCGTPLYTAGRKFSASDLLMCWHCHHDQWAPAAATIYRENP